MSDAGEREFDAAEVQSTAQLAHSVLRLVLAVRYRRNLVTAIMLAAALLGGLYYFTATRIYSSKAALLVTQTGGDHLDTSITSQESQRQNNMPTFENMATSAKVLEGAIATLSPADRIDLGNAPKESWVALLRKHLTAKAVRATTILTVEYTSKDPRVAANVVRAVVQSYLDFMDRIHKGTAGEISRILTKEREEVSDKLARKQEELLDCRRNFADMGFRSDGKTLHPMVQRAVYFNDALIAAQKRRVEQESLLASLETAVARGDDLGQYMVAVGDAVGREMLLSSLGLGSRDSYTQASMEQELISARAQLQTAQQNLGPLHPDVLAITEKIRLTEQFLASSQDRIGQRVAQMRQSQLGPWLVQMVRQKLDGSRKEEDSLKTCFEKTRAEAISLSGQLAKIEMLEHDVKRLGDMNDVLLNQIASLDLKQNGQDVRVAVIEEPAVVAGPVSPKLPHVALLTAMAGFGVALGLVTLLDALDDRFRSIDELQQRLGLPLLTMVRQLQPPARIGPEALVAHAMPTTAASESFRTLRTALSLTYPDAQQLVITSAEPGDGKTTMLANLAVCFAQGDKRTLLIDADLRRPGLTALMNMRGPHGLTEVLRSEADASRIAQTYIRPSGIKGLDVLPSGSRPIDPAELLGGPRLSQLLAWAGTVYDMILVDSPPTLATSDTAVIGRLVDGVILVVQPAKNRRRLVTRVVEQLGMMKIPLLGLVVNRTGSDEDSSYYGYHGYGYRNYDYGYGNEEAYGEAPDANHPPAMEEEHRDQHSTPFFEEASLGDADEDEPRRRIIPRRAA